MANVLGILVGPRFRLPNSAKSDLDVPVRAGHKFTFVVEAEQVSGTIYLIATKPWMKPQVYAAACSCGERSKTYKRSSSTELRGWAHAHLCDPLIMPSRPMKWLD